MGVIHEIVTGTHSGCFTSSGASADRHAFTKYIVIPDFQPGYRCGIEGYILWQSAENNRWVYKVVGADMDMRPDDGMGLDDSVIANPAGSLDQREGPDRHVLTQLHIRRNDSGGMNHEIR